MRKLLVASAVLALLLAGGALVLFFRSETPTERCHGVLHSSTGVGESVRLNHPMGLARDDEFLYVADTENGAVAKFRGDGSLAAKWDGFQRPVAVAVADAAIYVVDFLADRVAKLDRGGAPIGGWGRSGDGPGEFDAPSGIAVDRLGNVYVADFYNHRIQKFSGDGRFLSEWGEKGIWNGRFRYPAGIAVGDRGEVFVADAFNHRIQVFTADGQYLRKWGGIGYGLGGDRPGWFTVAKEVALDPRGGVYVADSFNGRVQKFTPQGSLLAIWEGGREGDAPLRYPAGVAVDPTGAVYVSDFFENRIWKLECR